MWGWYCEKLKKFASTCERSGPLVSSAIWNFKRISLWNIWNFIRLAYKDIILPIIFAGVMSGQKVAFSTRPNPQLQILVAFFFLIFENCFLPLILLVFRFRFCTLFANSARPNCIWAWIDFLFPFYEDEFSFARVDKVRVFQSYIYGFSHIIPTHWFHIWNQWNVIILWKYFSFDHKVKFSFPIFNILRNNEKSIKIFNANLME